MKVDRLVKQKVEVGAIRCVLPVRYEEDDMPNNAPFRKGDMWDVTIDADTGKIRDWPHGQKLDLHMKVTDEGRYTLMGPDDKELGKIDGDYVPSCVPGSYGDYVEFNIDKEGHIAGWKKFCTKANVERAFFGDDD